MILNTCKKCRFGAIKNGISHCGKEHIYSHLTRCIREQALKEFFERNTVSTDSR